MAGADNILQYLGEYVPSTEIWQVIQELSSANPNSDQFKELIVRLALIVNRINLAVNTKETGIYDNSREFIISSQYFPNPNFTSQTDQSPDSRPEYRTVIFPNQALPNAGTLSIPHNITCTATTSFTRFIGAATNPSTKYIPLPFVSATDVAHNIEINADTANVNIITGADYSAFTISYIILRYLQI